MSARMSPDAVNVRCWATPPVGGVCNRPTTSPVGLCAECLSRMRDSAARRPGPARRRPDDVTWGDVAAQLWASLFGTETP